MMTTTKDDQDHLLLTCDHCDYWPMAYQGPKSGDASFCCPRCRHTVMLRRGRTVAARAPLEAVMP